MNRRILFLLFLIKILFSPAAQSLPEKIIIGLPEQTYPPFHIEKENGTPDGIMVRPLLTILKKYNIKAEFILAPSPRLNRLMSEGKIHLRLKSRDWVKNPESYLWSEPIMYLEDVYVYTAHNRNFFEQQQNITGAVINTRLGFFYPALENFFSERIIKRNDFYTNQEMLENLLLMRAEIKAAAIINREVALWIINSNPDFQDRLFISDIPIESAPYQYQIIHTPSTEAFLPLLNQELRQMKQEGEIDRIRGAILYMDEQ